LVSIPPPKALRLSIFLTKMFANNLLLNMTNQIIT
jgi:hypothetical protein